MNTLNTLKIFESFDELCLLLGTLKRTGHLSGIERDLTLEKLRNMYSQLMSLEITEQADKVVSERKEEVVSQPEVIEEPAEKTKEIIEEEVKISVEEIESGNKQDQFTEQQDELVVEKEAIRNSDILSDRYAGNKKSRNELISEQHPSSDISGKQHLKPVADISKAIGLNDKFLFINELFKGDSMLYKNIIEQLNNAVNHDDAMNIVQQNFSWNMKEETTMKFLEIVKRKFL